MDFFNSLTLDLKILAVGIAGCALLALFAGNKAAEKRYLVVFTLLAAVGLYRFMHTAGERDGDTTAARSVPHAPKAETKHVPLVSTSARQP